MSDRDRDDSGRFTDSHSREDVFEAMEIGEPYTTSELADLLDVPRRTMYNILSDLHDESRIRKKKPEERRAIWIRDSQTVEEMRAQLEQRFQELEDADVEELNRLDDDTQSSEKSE